MEIFYHIYKNVNQAFEKNILNKYLKNDNKAFENFIMCMKKKTCIETNLQKYESPVFEKCEMLLKVDNHSQHKS